MKNKLLCACFLSAASCGVVAAWVEVGDNEKSTVYADPATIRRTGSMVKMWYLMDFKQLQVKSVPPMFSSKDFSEYDCKEVRARTLYFHNASENMGGGDIVFSNDTPDNWRPIPPESIRERLWNFACGK
jgi:hypothetical protein